MDSTKEVISSLKFIGKLQKGDKINTKFMFRQQDGFFTKLSRTFINNDNRQNTLSFIQKIINSSLDVFMYYENSNKVSDKGMCINILEDLKQAKNGLQNLKHTYSDDLKFNCDIDTMIQIIDSHLLIIEPKYNNNKRLSERTNSFDEKKDEYIVDEEDN